MLNNNIILWAYNSIINTTKWIIIPILYDYMQLAHEYYYIIICIMPEIKCTM